MNEELEVLKNNVLAIKSEIDALSLALTDENREESLKKLDVLNGKMRIYRAQIESIKLLDSIERIVPVEAPIV